MKEVIDEELLKEYNETNQRLTLQLDKYITIQKRKGKTDE
jgi:hypothetical protein